MNSYLPVMLLKDFVIFPYQETKLELNNNISDKIVKLSIKHHNGYLLIASPKNSLEETPDINDLPNVGVLVKIKSKLELPNKSIRVVLNGINRVDIKKYNNFEDDEDILMAELENIKEVNEDIVVSTALRRKLIELLKKYITTCPRISNSVLNTIKDVDDLGKVTDLIAAFLPSSLSKKILYIEEIDKIKRANALIYDLSVELEILKLDEQLDDAVEKDLQESQKEFMLRSKLNELKKQLGEEDEHNLTINNIKDRIDNLKAPKKIKDKLNQELDRYSKMNEFHPEASIIINYINTVLSLPYGIIKKEENDFDMVRKKLEKTHYGLQDVKDRIIEYLIAKKRNKDFACPIICLIGSPGIGKTTFASSVATSLNKEFYKISVGGLTDPNELIGHRRTYLGSSPGKIIQALIKCKVSNPLILIDEIDKMGSNVNGNPVYALLDILDPIQNKTFIDNFIEEPFDLSNVLFILTANDIESIPYVLRDRLEIINLNSYSLDEKIIIGKKYLIPNILNNYNLGEDDIIISEEIINIIINKYTKEAGVRDLYRKLDTIFRKELASGLKEKVVIDKNDIKKYLGTPKYDILNNTKTQEPGLVNALAYTSVGGIVMPLECCMFEGKGKIITTGLLGKTMDESISVALSYIKSHLNLFKISDYYFTSKDIHLHAISGSIPKDGPSAGIAIVSSILSLLLNIEIPRKIAMTGEISLRGDILEVGALKEKILGAYNSGITKIYIPALNINDLDDIPLKVRKKIDIISVSNYKEIFKDLFR